MYQSSSSSSSTTTIIWNQIIPLLSILTISLSSAVLRLLRKHPHCITNSRTGKTIYTMTSHIPYTTWRYVHIGSYIMFVTITSIASALEIIAICYYRRYDRYSYAIEILDRRIVLPFLTIGLVSGVAMVSIQVHDGKCLDSTLDQFVQLFNRFGLFWVVVDVAVRNTVLRGMSLPMLLFLIRVFVNVVCMRIIFLLRYMMQSLASSIEDEKSM